MTWLRLLLLLALCVASLADITGQNPPHGTCLCVTASVLNVRDRGCGSVIGSAATNACFKYQADKVSCDLSGTWYEFFHFDYNGQAGWGAGNFLRTGSDTECDGGTAPDTEFRALFVASAVNIDWPSSAGLPTDTARNQLQAYVDLVDDLNANAIVFQIRPAGDALYSSTLEPWSRYLTGTQGVAPSPFWDPLDYLVTEAHRLGIEVHVWLNPYRANLSPTTSGLAANHMCLTLSQYCYTYGNYMWMDPGAEAVVDHIINVIDDVITRYDVDGVHFDDYFYPYPAGGVDFPDDNTYNDYVNGGGSLGRADWRRENVNTMVERVYNHIHSVKPAAKFSISPFGIYRPGHASGMPPPITGFDPYTAMFADSLKWLQSGWLDFFSPQQYWSIAAAGQSYPLLLDWWLSANTANRHVYVANGVYKCYDANDWPVSEIENQVAESRARSGQLSLGNLLFSAKYFRDNNKGITDAFKARVYTNKATIPPMDWLPGVRDPDAPIGAKLHSDTHMLEWEPARGDGVHTWTVYKRGGRTWQLLKIIPRDVTSFRVGGPGTYAIRGKNRANILSEPTIVSMHDPTGVA